MGIAFIIDTELDMTIKPNKTREYYDHIFITGIFEKDCEGEIDTWQGRRKL